MIIHLHIYKNGSSEISMFVFVGGAKIWVNNSLK